MWPFGNTKEQKQQPCNVATAAEAAIATLKEWRDIGEEFTYLGRTMIVTAHSRCSMYAWTIFYIPCICADYADDNGVIHQAVFSALECEALIAKQPNTGGNPRERSAAK